MDTDARSELNLRGAASEVVLLRCASSGGGGGGGGGTLPKPLGLHRGHFAHSSSPLLLWPRNHPHSDGGGLGGNAVFDEEEWN